MARAAAPRPAARRETVTFEPYFWEAYNEIVRPDHRYWYFVRRWLPALSGNAVKIIMALRGQLYFNPRSGELRNVIDDLDLRRLAELTGLSVKTLTREFKKMEDTGDVEGQHLKAFLSKSPTWAQVGQNRFQQRPNTYYVAMDDPIHPDDRDWYEALREQKERERMGREEAQPGRKRVVKDPIFLDGQTDHQEAFDGGQVGHQEEQSVPPGGQSDHQYSKDSLLLSTKTTAALTPKPNGLPPEGVESAEDIAPWASLWRAALPRIAELLNKPTFEAHVRTLVPLSLSEAREVTPGDPNGQTVRVLTLRVPSPFTRDWLEKRHDSALNAALSETAGEPVTARLTLAAAQPVHRDRRGAAP